MTLRRGTRILFLVAVVMMTASGCGPFGGDGEGAAIEQAVLQFTAGLSDHKLVGNELSRRVDAVAALELSKPLADIQAITVDRIKQSGDGASAELHWNVNVEGHPWRHTTRVSLIKRGNAWKVVWKPSVVESSLTKDETLSVVSVKAGRGNILGKSGRPLVEPRPVIRFGIDKAQVSASAVARSAKLLAVALEIEPAPFGKAVLAAGPKAFVQALVLRRSEASSSLLGRVAAIPGASSISDHQALAPSKDFAAALLGTVGPVTAEIVKKSGGRLRAGDDAGLSGLQLRYDEQLGGTRGVRISAVPKDPNIDRRALFNVEPVAGKPLLLTLDLALQATAQRLLERYGPASALVAIKPSTGEILAAASGPGSKGYNTATFGQYAPGSTFKIVSSLALLRAGLKPTSTVPCPASVTVLGKRFKNYSDYPSNRFGMITLTQAVANSCNTAFISERKKIVGTGLADAAAALGFGDDHDLGFPAYFGQVPAAQGETEAAADLIGQGKVLASPMAMATVVASVMRGGTVVPRLVAGGEPVTAKASKPLTPAEARSLRALMRAVVTEGSGIRLASLGANPPVYAKTGTAEYGDVAPLRTHAWMVGARGDLAVAVFVADGESGSQTAGPVLEAFLRAAFPTAR